MKAFRAKPGYYCEGVIYEKLYAKNSKIVLFICYSD